MKTFNINPKSWHYRLAKTYSNFHPGYESELNLCSYMRCVFKGAFVALFITIAIAFLAVSTECLIIAGIVWIQTGTFIFSGEMLLAVTALALALICSIIGAIAWLIEYADEHWIDHTKKVEPGFVREAYTSFKEKTCVRISVNRT